MRLWFSHNSEVPVYQQLMTQVVLGILSGELKPGDRLPSTRELARRFAIHPNTASAGYRKLEEAGWTVQRRGSGVYVRSGDSPATAMQILDRRIVEFFRTVRELKLPASDVRERVEQWIASPAPDHFLLIDPDVEARRILTTELREIVSHPVREATLEETGAKGALDAAIPLCRPSQSKAVAERLPVGTELVVLPIRSPQALLEEWAPVRRTALLGLVSRWPEFLGFGRTMLMAAGVSPESLVIRDANSRQWQRGLERTDAVICDAYAATLPQLPKRARKLVFRLLADHAKDELVGYLSRSLL